MIDPALWREARALVESQGLRFEPDLDDLVGLYEHDRLIGCGARQGYVLKMLALEPEHQGTSALGDLITQLLASARRAGHDTVFIYTTPQAAPSFQAMNFRLLVAQGAVALLEHGPGLEAYLADHAREMKPGRNGAIVLNANPFTLGHQHLVEEAAHRCDQLYLFVVREDRSVFPFAVREALVREGTAHLPNVTVLDTSRYAVSAGTFPSYFLKRLEEASRLQMDLDLRLFAQRLAPPFQVVTRYVGQEPHCPTTAAYNRRMSEILAEHAIHWVEIPRIEASGGAISATRVRKALLRGDFSALESLVPPTTLRFLASPQGRPIVERLRTSQEATP
ncbi:MAG: [citrate (pro-3S)-lyase] ligase [Firmicutes bacterium]|nr:[citrate (pro-3S)-lyase] ligase [Bacillota bacterium]